MFVYFLLLFPVPLEMYQKKKTYLCWCSRNSCLFSSKFSYRIIRVLIHFKFIFVFGLSWSSFIFSFACSCPVFRTALIEENVFFPISYIFLPHLSYIIWPYRCVLEGFSILLHWFMYVCLCLYCTYCFNPFSFVV